MVDAPWQGTWLNEPPEWEVVDGVLRLRTATGTDFWQGTGYGYGYDTGHFLGLPVGREAGVELVFDGDYAAQFDQAGLMLRAGPERWVKAGVELADGVLSLSVVATMGRSDWSVMPLPPAPTGTLLTLRASRAHDAVAVRYGLGRGEAGTLLRLLPVDDEDDWLVGPFACSPAGPGTGFRFLELRVGPPDASIHPA